LPETVLLQVTHLDQILLNGNNIAVLVPGGKPEGQ
jgi:U6 snRNA-associated Sm-like protein LSm5